MIKLLSYRAFGAYAFCVLLKFNCYAQLITGPVGAEQWMLGGNSAAVANVWGTTNNAATITQINKFQVGVYSEQRFAESKLQLSNVSIVQPFKYVHVGLAVNHFGYSVYNQQRICLSVAKKLSNTFSLGVQLNYVSTFIQDYGTAGNPTLGLGLYAKPLPKLALAFVVFNPTQETYGKNTQEKIPAYARLGCGYILSEKLRLNIEADQQLNQELIWRAGVYYKIHDVLHLAIGAATKPTYYTFGTALVLKKVKVDIAMSLHEALGLTPHVGLSLPIQK
jgi:hypothetical protein